MIDDYDEDCQYYFWCQSKIFRLILSCHMIWGGIRKDITLLISSWLPFGQNELCSDGNKMHSNLFQSSEKVRSFFKPYMISIHTCGMITKFRIQKETIRNSTQEKIWEPCELVSINCLRLHSTSTEDKKKKKQNRDIFWALGYEGEWCALFRLILSEAVGEPW